MFILPARVGRDTEGAENRKVSKHAIIVSQMSVS
jgi:hypothetical protein